MAPMLYWADCAMGVPFGVGASARLTSGLMRSAAGCAKLVNGCAANVARYDILTQPNGDK